MLASIPGFGLVTAHALLADMPELGTREEGQAASLAGLAPITRQSGPWRGRSFIQGGRAPLRQALCMPVMAAMRFNPDLKRVYGRLNAKGKHAKIAITAIMRKLVILANALLRDDRLWMPKAARFRLVIKMPEALPDRPLGLPPVGCDRSLLDAR
ncbi:transposase [Acetobacter senegalensis]